MATVIGANREEFILREMARRAGKVYEPETVKTANPYQNMTVEELKGHKALMQEALKDIEE
jgi:hypothetical protein